MFGTLATLAAYRDGDDWLAAQNEGDYARYAAYQLSAYPPRDDPETGPVRRSTLREMHEGQRWVYFLSPWGMQFELVSYPGGKAFDRQRAAAT